jgi:hypothetical protein
VTTVEQETESAADGVEPGLFESGSNADVEGSGEVTAETKDSEKEPEKEKVEEKAEEKPEEPEAPKDFTFHPQDGSDPITVTSVQEAIPPGKQRWFFWKLRKLQGLEQPIFWLDQAGIPDHLQEKIMLLPDQEWARFYEEWMADGAGATPGE